MIKKVQLNNGLTVLKNKQPKSPVVSLQIWIETGSANETEDVAGVSHFIEHLVFKGTESFGPGEIAQRIEGAGGQLNAYTSFDQTVYYVTLGSSELNLGLKVLSEMVFKPTFDKEEIDREREVVIEEIKRGLDEPSRVNSQFAFKSFFREHNYARPIIGYDKVVQEISVENIKRYFYSMYHPENMFLMVTGDFDDAKIDSEINKFFNQNSRAQKVSNEISKIINKNSKDFMLQKTEFEETVMNFYWPSAKLNTKDFICLEVLALILGQGESSVLYKTMKLDKSIVKTIGCYAYSLKQPGVFAINYKPNDDQELESLKEFNVDLNNFCKSGINPSDFEKAITNFKSEIYYSMETCDGLARMIGQNFFYSKDENYSEKYFQILDEIEISDLEKVFNDYILNVEPKLFVSMSKKKNFEKDIESFFKEDFKLENKIAKNSSKKKSNAKAGWKPRAPKDSKIQKIVLDCGAQLFLKPQNETPVVQMDMAFLGGEKIDPKKGALSLIAQRSWGRETTSMSEAEVAFYFDNLATSHGVFSGKHSLGTQVTTLSESFVEVMKVNFDLLKKIDVSQKIIDRDHASLKQYYKSRNDNPAQIAFLEFTKQIYRNHYYQNDALEELNNREKIESKTLSKFLQSHFNFKNSIITVVGDVDTNKVVDSFNQYLKDAPNSETEVNFELASPLDENKFSKVDMTKEQAQIIFGFRGLTYSDDKRAILSVIQSILSGQGGRLFLELRDKASLAYTVSPIRMEGQEGGYFGSYIACAPGKKEKAIEMMKAEFEKLCTQKVAATELVSAKQSIIGRSEISLQRNSEIAERILFDALYGETYNSYQFYSDKIKAVSAEDVMALINDLYNQPHVLVTLG